MSFATSIAAIEGREFDARLNLANNMDMFLYALKGEPAVKELLAHVRDDANVARELLRRLQRLLQEMVDIRYRNPRDVPIAAYVWVLSVGNPAFGNLAAQTTLRLADRCWWAVKTARLSLEGTFVMNRTETTVERLISVAATRPIAEDTWTVVFVPPTRFDLMEIGFVLNPSTIRVGVARAETTYLDWLGPLPFDTRNPIASADMQR